MKRALSLILSIMLAAGMISFSGISGPDGQYLAIEAAAAEAEDAEESTTLDEFLEQSETIAEIAEQISDPENDPFDYTTEAARAEALATAKSTYPESLDLRDVDGVSYVTPVKFQDPYGDCWGFAAIAAAETSILGDDALRGNYTADVRLEPGKIQMDLSEKHLAYFARTAIKDPNNSQNGEGSIPGSSDGNDEIALVYDIGGAAPTATNLFATGAGPVLESEDPLLEYKGKNGTIKKEWVDGKYRNYCYSPSPQDDWTLDESMRFMRSFDLKESFFLPSPASISEDGNFNVYEFNEAGVAAIKSQLLLKRGVEIAYKDDSFNLLRGETHGRYINDNWSQYTFDAIAAKHAVCIIGYDDNYPAENFRHESDDPEDYSEEDTVPPGDGAFLVKNSWGSGLEEFPNKAEGVWGIQEAKTDANGDPVTDAYGNPVMAGTGYFWLSYYDKSIERPEALSFDNVDETCNVIDQYDYITAKDYNSAHVANEVRTANVFKAGVCEELRAVSCETTYPGTEVTFEIYLLANSYTDPTDGLLMDTVTAGPFEYGGYHKVSLNNPFTVMRGQSYAIVVTQKVPEEGGGSSYVLSIKKTNFGNSVINEGESLVYADGVWMDFSDVKVRAAVMGIPEGLEDYFVYDNFPIKGFAAEKPDVILEVDGSEQDPEYDEYPIVYLLAWITDNTGGDYDVIPTWRLAEGSEEIVELADGRDPTRKTLIRHKLGGAYVIVTAEGIGTAIYSTNIYMRGPIIDKIETGDDSVTITTKDELEEKGIHGYELSYRLKGDSSWTTKDYSPAENILTLTRLKKGTYELMLRYYAEVGDRKYYSNEEMEECTVGPAVTLAATTRVYLTNVVSGIKVSWEKVEGAKYYKVYRGNKFLVSTSRLFCTDQEVKGKNGTKYTYRVVASLTKDDSSGDSSKSRTGTGYCLTPCGIRSLTNPAAGKMTVTYAKNAKAYGYVIRYGLKSDMSDAKVVTVQGAGTTTRTFSGLTKGKTYYVQVRPYILENNIRYYSGFSTVRSVKIEK